MACGGLVNRGLDWTQLVKRGLDSISKTRTGLISKTRTGLISDSL
jgi:hypothetical protein